MREEGEVCERMCVTMYMNSMKLGIELHTFLQTTTSPYHNLLIP